MAGLLFFLAKAAFDDGLSGDTGMVCTWKPEDFVSGLARAAGQNVLQCVIENMPERENASDIGWRNDDRESRFGRGLDLATKHTIYLRLVVVRRLLKVRT